MMDAKTIIMVIDDEENIRLLYREELTDDGYDVILAQDSSTALQKLSDTRPDLIILDIRMPGVDGIELLNKIRAEDSAIPIIMCTAYSDYKQNFNVWASDAYIVKSSDLTELKLKIKEIFKSKEKENNNVT